MHTACSQAGTGSIQDLPLVFPQLEACCARFTAVCLASTEITKVFPASHDLLPVTWVAFQPCITHGGLCAMAHSTAQWFSKEGGGKSEGTTNHPLL